MIIIAFALAVTLNMPMIASPLNAIVYTLDNYIYSIYNVAYYIAALI